MELLRPILLIVAAAIFLAIVRARGPRQLREAFFGKKPKGPLADAIEAEENDRMR